MKHRHPFSTLALWLGSTALLCAAAVQAQTVYRIVGADGKVTFSDKPPVSPTQGKVAGTGVGAAASTAAAGGALPFELRQVAAKFPVTLYTAAQCAPCDTGRALLTGRGVPFSERTVTTPEDIEAFQRISGDTSLPFLSIGGQRIRGLSEVEWRQYLDAAGYPKTSVLPASYKPAPATPLVALHAAPAPTPPKAVEAPPTPTPAPPPGPNAANPAGIQF